MSGTNNYSMLVFSLDGQRYALPHSVVTRVIRAMEITALPNAPAGVLGIINIHGNLITTIDIRQYLGLAAETMKTQDYMVIVQKQKPSTSQSQSLSFIVQDVFFAEFPASSVSSTEMITKNIDCIDKMIKDRQGIIHILNIDKLLENSYLQNLENTPTIKSTKALGDRK